MSRYNHTQPPASWRYISACIALFLAALCAVLTSNAHATELVGPVIEDTPEAPVVQPSVQKDTRCLERWRLINIGSQIADTGLTVSGIGSGRGVEANPLIRGIFGKRPEWYELVAFKAATVAIIEWQAQKALDRGDAKAACRQHKIGAVFGIGAAALNLRILF